MRAQAVQKNSKLEIPYNVNGIPYSNLMWCEVTHNLHIINEHLHKHLSKIVYKL